MTPYVRGLRISNEGNIMDSACQCMLQIDILFQVSCWHSIFISRHGNLWKCFPHHWPFVAGISFTDSRQYKLLMSLLLFVWTGFSRDNRDYPDLRITLMWLHISLYIIKRDGNSSIIENWTNYSLMYNIQQQLPFRKRKRNPHPSMSGPRSFKVQF